MKFAKPLNPDTLKKLFDESNKLSISDIGIINVLIKRNYYPPNKCSNVYLCDIIKLLDKDKYVDIYSLIKELYESAGWIISKESLEDGDVIIKFNSGN